MKMSKEFHLQQRWYSHIEIDSKPFISGQGPANFGASLVQNENIVIKNSILGLTSHHGIHCNSVDSITISDLVLKEFEVAGFNGVTMENVKVGPCYQQVLVLGLYTQARVMLPWMRAVAEETVVWFLFMWCFWRCDNFWNFLTISDVLLLLLFVLLYFEFVKDEAVYLDYRTSGTQEETMDDLAQLLKRQMDAIFGFVFEGKKYGDNDLILSKAKETFQNENGIPSASTIYGVFLNSLDASVFAVGGAPGHSTPT